MTANEAEALLDAGAVLPTGVVDGDDDARDVLTARAYRHPALDDRSVVRLVPAILGGAEDLSMEFLGFDGAAGTQTVGVVRRRALGFPAWALVHDPANGHHALALVKEMERLARVAKSRIGPAKDGFVALGERLARSVPHFLPTYYEEAARAFLAAESTSYAATMFGKARDAEKAYGLAVDAERQHAVFLEFALAGAVTVKALSAYARDLAATYEPGTAYQRFRRLCVERTLGGLPPYAAMHTDLRRLAKAAKLGEEDERRLLGELIGAPAVVRAPAPFWVAYRPALVGAAREDPAVAGRLLSVFPTECPGDVWLAILEESGAARALTEPRGTVEAAAEPADGPAGWLTRLDRHREGWRRKRSPELLALVARMAPRLIADGVPVRLGRAHDVIDLDVVDLCLELGVPLHKAARQTRYGVQQWLTDDTEGRRDLSHVVADRRMRAGLVDGIESYLRPSWRDKADAMRGKVRALVAVPGLHDALRVWLDRLADKTDRRGIVNLGGQLDRLALVACPEGRAVNPAAIERILDRPLAALLGRTLRAGILDEFGWPALEAARVALTAAATTARGEVEQIHLTAQWPYLVLRAGDRVAVIDGDGVVLEHQLRIPPDQRRWMWRTALRYVDGQLLVSWDIGSERANYWSGAPDEVFISPDDAFSLGDSFGLELPGGGRTAGGRPLHVGDRAAEERARVASDGVTYWVWWRAADGNDLTWREYDPATGDLGRASVPSFFATGEGEPHLASCWLLPAPAGAASSPLGAADGLVGWRVSRAPDHGWVGVATGGLSFTLAGRPGKKKAVRDGTLMGAMRFPGGGDVAGLLWTSTYGDRGLRLCASDGFVFGRYGFEPGKDRYAAGTPLLPPVAFWHYLRPRDEAGSKALRALTDEQAGALLEGAVKQKPEAVLALVSKVLPEITDPALLAGVAGVVTRAAKHRRRLAKLAADLAGVVDTGAAPKRRKAKKVADPDDTRPTDGVLMAALRGLLPYCYDRGRSAVELIGRTGELLVAPGGGATSVPKAITNADSDWLQALGVLPAAMLRAVSPVTPPEQREALLGLLSVCVGSGLVVPGGRVRLAWSRPTGAPGVYADGQIIDVDGRRVAILDVDTSDNEIRTLEFTPDGRFAVIPGYAVHREEVVETGRVARERVEAFVALARQRGPVSWGSEWAAGVSDAAGMSRAEAAVLLAGVPDHKAWTSAAPEGATGEAYATAIQGWDNRPRAVSVEAFAALLPDDPAALWDAGPDVGRLASWWAGRNGARRPVDDELIVAVHKAHVPSGMSASELLHGLANPATCRWLAGPVEDVSDDDVLVSVVKAVPWLAYRLPAAHPVRAALPEAVRLMRGRVTDPGLLLDVGYLDEKKVPAFTAATGAPVRSDDKGIDAGAVFFPPDEGWRQVQLRPAKLSGADDPVFDLIAARLDDVEEGPVAAVRALLGNQLAEWVAAPDGSGADRAGKNGAEVHGSEVHGAEVHGAGPEGAGGAEHDPSRSAPELVAEVAATHGISTDAATVYLQLLALPDPTDRNVAAWTGWKPARLKAARAELAATDLVVDAKRARAGRTLFLPGGWLALRAPHLPLETWKQPLLVGGAGAIDGLGMVIPAAPVPRLFALAWARVRAGDPPRFDTLVTNARGTRRR